MNLLRHETQPVLACVAPPSIFNFYPTVEAAAADQRRANASCLAPAGGYAVMTYGAFLVGMRTWYLRGPLCRITPEQYTYALEVLPPLQWEDGDGVNRFLMLEFEDGPYTQQYAVYEGDYYCRMVDAGDRTTWITAAECAAYATNYPGQQPEKGTDDRT